MHSVEHSENGEIDVLPIFGSAHAVNFHVPENRDDVNLLLDEVTESPSGEYHSAYDRVAEILYEAGYSLPTPSLHLIDGSGESIFSLMLHEGDTPTYLYFAFSVVYEDNSSEVIAEILTEGELSELFDEED